MIAVAGTYQNGYLQLYKEYAYSHPVKVIVTFLEEVDAAPGKRLSLTGFSFAQSKKALENYSGSLSDSVIEE